MPEWTKNQTTAEQNNGCYDEAKTATQFHWTICIRIKLKWKLFISTVLDTKTTKALSLP